MSVKGRTVKSLSRVCSPKAWTVWIKLDCLKSSGELETRVPSTQRLKSSLVSNTSASVMWEISLTRTRSMRPLKPRTDSLTRPIHVTYDRTAGLPTEREFYGNGVSIVVVGVTTHQGGW